MTRSREFRIRGYSSSHFLFPCEMDGRPNWKAPFRTAREPWGDGGLRHRFIPCGPLPVARTAQLSGDLEWDF
jgi:hypothetical protein